LFYKGDYENFRESIPFFQKAVDQDPEFARAYAMLTITYYLLDEPLAEKQFTDQISYNADKAILLDAQLPQSLIAMALVYMHSEDYELAIPYFEKALEYNPNYDAAFMFLVDLYVNHLPDTEKYLEYTLRGLQIDISAYDSTAKSINYLHISNAFIQSGFVEEAEKYINMSLDYQPDNLYSQYVKAYIDYAKNGDLERSRDMVIAAFRQDTTRLDILNEVAKFYYFLGDYEMAYAYYKPFNDVREAYNLNIFPVENAKIGVVLDKLGLEEESNKYFAKFKNHADNDQSIYKHVNLAMYYSYMGEIDKALEHLEIFSEEEHYFLWAVILMEVDPLVDNIKDLPRFKKIKKKIDDKFWDYHNQIRASLEKKGLI
jgi:tetratricopeptide (TPR) repeat protein